MERANRTWPWLLAASGSSGYRCDPERGNPRGRDRATRTGRVPRPLGRLVGTVSTGRWAHRVGFVGAAIVAAAIATAAIELELGRQRRSAAREARRARGSS